MILSITIAMLSYNVANDSASNYDFRFTIGFNALYAPVIWNPRTPPPPHSRAWAGHSLFMQVKVSEFPGSRGQKWVVHSPAPTFQHMVLPL